MELTLEQRAKFSGQLGNHLLQDDIATLGANGASDTVLSLMAMEHHGRTEALLNCVQDATMARNLLLITSRRLLDKAKEIDARTKNAVFVEGIEG